MQFSLAQLDPNLLSLTGVIFTILAVIFAIGAFYNSRTRKKHLQELERAQKEEHVMHFRPATSHHPGRSTRPGQSSRPHRTAHPAARAAPAAEERPKPAPKSESRETRGPAPSGESENGKQALFRKVRPNGAEPGAGRTEEDEGQYVWE